jgi:hypothetical protein
VIEFGHTVYDFGLQPPNKETILRHEFPFRNTGVGLLRILDAGQACRTAGGTRTTQVAPDGASTITLTVNLPSSYTTTPRFERNVKVTTNDPNHPAVELRVVATFAYSLASQPENLDAGSFSATEGKSTSLVLVSRLPAPFRILKCATSGGIFDVTAPEQSAAPTNPAPAPENRTPDASPLSADVKTLVTRNPQAVISLKSRPGRAVGPFVDTLEIRTDRRDIPVVSIPISGQVTDGLTVEPHEVFFGIIRSEKPVVKEVQIVSSDSSFKILAFSSPIVGLQGKTEKAEKTEGGYRLLLTLDPTGIDGPFEGQAVLQTEPASVGDIRIRIWGLVKSPAKPEGTK